MHKKYIHILSFLLLLLLYIGFFFILLVFLIDHDYLYRPEMLKSTIQEYYIQIPYELALYIIVFLAESLYVFFFGSSLVITVNIILISIIVWYFYSISWEVPWFWSEINIWKTIYPYFIIKNFLFIIFAVYSKAMVRKNFFIKVSPESIQAVIDKWKNS
jgi:hypothetical protein